MVGEGGEFGGAGAGSSQPSELEWEPSGLSWDQRLRHSKGGEVEVEDLGWNPGRF